MTRLAPGLLLIFSVTALSEGTPPRPSLHLHLEGDTRACDGKLQVHSGRLYWKSSFSLCDSAVRVVAEDESSWTFKLHGRRGKAAHACPFRTVKVQLMTRGDYSLWQIIGDDGTTIDGHANTATQLDCNMQSSQATGDSMPGR